MTSNQKKSKRQEISGAKKYGGRRTPGSGNTWVRKNDVRTETESIEFKTTKKDRYTLDVAELSKAYDYALIDGRIMLFAIKFERAGRTFIVMDETDYFELRELSGRVEEE